MSEAKRCRHRDFWVLGMGPKGWLWCPECGAIREYAHDGKQAKATGKWRSPKSKAKGSQ